MTTPFRSHALRILAPLCILSLFGAGCFGGATTSVGLDGGVFRTADNGTTWQQMSALNLGTKIGSIADVGIVTVAVDPQDPQAIYAGTVQNGLLYSLDGGMSWQSAKGLSSGKVTAVSVDPKDKCTIYAARGNQIHKTTNCSRDWNLVYVDSRPDVVFNALVVDWFNANRVYIGSSLGDVSRSDDGGVSWARLTQDVSSAVTGVEVDPRDSRTIYVGTYGSGLLKTVDGGQTWQSIYKQFADYDYSRRVTQIVVDPHLANTVYSVSKYGILRTQDGGATWSPLKLPTPNGTVTIRSLAVHPGNSSLLVYATDNNLVFSADGGQTWMPKKTPTTRGTAVLRFDSPSTTALFLGAMPAK